MLSTAIWRPVCEHVRRHVWLELLAIGLARLAKSEGLSSELVVNAVLDPGDLHLEMPWWFGPVERLELHRLVARALGEGLGGGENVESV